MIDISLVDVPQIPVTVIMTGGCNFRCHYCQNAELIPLDSGIEMPISEIVQHARGNMTDGYCITGGEPTIHHDLPQLLRELREERSKHINLNTQGSMPDVLERSIPYLDSVWFDIKAPPGCYERITQRKRVWPKIRRSLELLMEAGVRLWPRTTYVGDLMVPEEIIQIAELLHEMGFKGRYAVQKYIPRNVPVPGSNGVSMRVPMIEEVLPLLEQMPQGIQLEFNWS